jgi:hypothetical protein
MQRSTLKTCYPHITDEKQRLEFELNLVSYVAYSDRALFVQSFSAVLGLSPGPSIRLIACEHIAANTKLPSRANLLYHHSSYLRTRPEVTDH